MSEKSRESYVSIARALPLPSGAFINGKSVPAQSGQCMGTLNPAEGSLLTTVANCQSEDVDLAVRAARAAFKSGSWSRMAPENRKQVLLSLAELIRKESEALAVLESLESGKPISDCLHEIKTLVPNTFQWFAELLDKTFGKVAPTGQDACALIVKEPIGVVGLVLPWNFPLLMAAWKMGPALASGCSVIVKPAEQTSMTSLRLAELACEAGIPPGVVNIVPGLGDTAGAAIGLHNDIDLVSFTGSTEVGRCFLRYSSESNLKPIGLEMGGKSPLVVLDDADISRDLVENAITSAFWNGGQNCSANMRQIVDRKVYDAFVEAVTTRAKSIVIGDPLDPNTEMGPMISLEHREKVLRFVDSGITEGGEVALDMSREYMDNLGYYVGPTVFSKMSPKMRIAQEEIFGPVLGIMVVDGVDEALEVANNTEYGLHATIYTKDLDRAIYLARNLACGTVAINGFTEGNVTTPFGGYKKSGSLARDNGTEAMDQYLQTKTIWISTSHPSGVSS